MQFQFLPASFFYSKVDSTFAFTISLVTTGESSVEDFPVFLCASLNASKL